MIEYDMYMWIDMYQLGAVYSSSFCCAAWMKEQARQPLAYARQLLALLLLY